LRQAAQSKQIVNFDEPRQLIFGLCDGQFKEMEVADLGARAGFRLAGREV